MLHEVTLTACALNSFTCSVFLLPCTVSTVTMPQKSKRTLRYEKAGQRLVEYNEEKKRLRLPLESRNKKYDEQKARRRIAYYVKKELKRRQSAILSAP